MFSAAKTSKPAGGYVVGRSLRFRSSASAYLNRTPASAGSRTTWTYSVWLKKGGSSGSNGYQYLTSATTVGSTNPMFVFRDVSDQLDISNNDSGGTNNLRLTTTAVYRDFSAWYHFVLAIDTTQATASNRAKLYVNGVQVTAFATATYPSQNTSLDLNGAIVHNIGREAARSNYYTDGYMAEINFIDGQALTPSYFGAYDTNGVWQPLKYNGTYGTNGFYLPFSNTTSTTTLVQDSSGNGNNWTPNNISLTAGTTYDSMIDSPTVSASSSNYAVLNPLTNGSYTTLSGGNLNTSGNTVTNNGNSRSSFAFTTGKWYAEFTVTGVNSTYPQYGIMQSSDAQSPNNAAPQAGYGSILNSVAYRADGTKVIANTSSAYGSSYTTNDVIGIAIDADNGAVYFSKNGTFQNSGVPTSGSSKTGAALTWTGSSVELVIAIAEYNGSGSATNFGQRPFTYTPPTGYSALNTYNLPTPTIKNGALYNAATLYTGNSGGTQSIVNSQSNGGNNALGKTFQPDFLWIKYRAGISNWAVADSVRGNTKQLSSSLTNAEVTTTDGITAFNSNGFSLGANTTGYDTNTNSGNYVAYQWNAGSGSSSSNTSGSITSTVSANTTAGFSVVTFTSTTGTGSVGHGLGVAPSFAILKNRSTTGNWGCYHTSLGNNQYINLNSTSAAATSAGSWATSSTTMSIDQTNLIGSSGTTCVLYCFAAVRGYSAFGSYTGNGSTDGPFIYTGFRPRWIMVKRSDGAESWLVWDSSRSTYNLVNTTLFPNLANDEGSIGTSITLDILSNGFKLRNSTAAGNISSATYVYAAFAENPFNYSRAR